MKKIRYLSVAEAEWFHDRILELTGGERGDLAKANLEFVLERVKDIGEGLDREKAVVKKAAFLLRSLVFHHPFMNGNKRTAFEVMGAFLELNGYILGAKTDEIYALLTDMGAGKSSETQAEYWIAMNLGDKNLKTRRRS